MSQIITVTNKGRLTLPAGVRKALHIEEEAQLQVDVEGDTVTLRPVVMIPREDAWAYTPAARCKTRSRIVPAARFAGWRSAPIACPPFERLSGRRVSPRR